MKRFDFHLRETEKRDAAWVRRCKAQRPAVCEACAWVPPSFLDVEGALPVADLLHAHHVLPVAHGGPEAEWNIAILCPTCHAIAHRLTVRRRAADGTHVVVGPRTRDELLATLRAAAADPVRARAEHAARLESLAAALATTNERVTNRRRARASRGKRAQPGEDARAVTDGDTEPASKWAYARSGPTSIRSRPAEVFPCVSLAGRTPRNVSYWTVTTPFMPIARCGVQL
jgi:hypothetical protein